MMSLPACSDDSNRPVFSHMDGMLKPLWADIARSKVGGLDSFTPTPDCDTPVDQAVRIWPEKRLWLNFPSSVHLAPPEQIRATADQILDGRRAHGPAADPDFRERAAGRVADKPAGHRRGDRGVRPAVTGIRGRMAIHDLRSYLAVLEAAGQLARVRKPVSLDYELADVAATLERQGGPAPLFERFDASCRDTTIQPWPVFSSAVANQARVALALECGKDEVVEVMGRGLDPANGVAPVRVERAAWEDNVVTRRRRSTCARCRSRSMRAGDGGPFITGGVTVSKDPVSGRGNLSYNRMQVKGPARVRLQPERVAARHAVPQGRERRIDEGLPVAIAIGLDPAISIAAGARYDGDELCIAGALRGEGVKVRRGLTVDVDIPAEAEIVIEGYLGPHERRGEGALAEFHGYFGEIWESPVFHVTAVCWRDDPIFQTIIPGWNEHVYIGNVLPREPLLLKFVRHVSKNVTGLHIPPYSSGFSAIVAIDKSNPASPRTSRWPP